MDLVLAKRSTAILPLHILRDQRRFKVQGRGDMGITETLSRRDGSGISTPGGDQGHLCPSVTTTLVKVLSALWEGDVQEAGVRPSTYSSIHRPSGRMSTVGRGADEDALRRISCSARRSSGRLLATTGSAEW